MEYNSRLEHLGSYGVCNKKLLPPKLRPPHPPRGAQRAALMLRIATMEERQRGLYAHQLRAAAAKPQLIPGRCCSSCGSFCDERPLFTAHLRRSDLASDLTSDLASDLLPDLPPSLPPGLPSDFQPDLPSGKSSRTPPLICRALTPGPAGATLSPDSGISLACPRCRRVSTPPQSWAARSSAASSSHRASSLM